MNQDKQKVKKTHTISIACRFEGKYCDACCLGLGIIWEGEPPNETYKLGQCIFCHGENR